MVTSRIHAFIKGVNRHAHSQVLAGEFRKFDPNEPRDASGKWTSTGGTVEHREFTDPNGRTRHYYTARDAAGGKAGFLEVVDHVDDNVLHVDETKVSPEYRHHGAATAMYQAAMQTAREHGRTALESGYSVSDSAAGVWRRLGGEEFKETPGSSPRFRISVHRGKVAKAVGLHKSACVLFPLPAAIASRVLEAGRQIPAGDLAGDGQEQQVHVTVKYGFQDAAVDAVRRTVAGTGPIRCKLDLTTVFPPSKSSDGAAVVVVEVHSPGLRRLHAQLLAVDGAQPDTFPYHPHVTLAYVRPEVAEQYADGDELQGEGFTIDQVQFVTTTGQTFELPLEEPAPPPTPAPIGKAAHPVLARGRRLRFSHAAVSRVNPEVQAATQRLEDRLTVELRRAGRAVSLALHRHLGVGTGVGTGTGTGKASSLGFQRTAHSTQDTTHSTQDTAIQRTDAQDTSALKEPVGRKKKRRGDAGLGPGGVWGGAETGPDPDPITKDYNLDEPRDDHGQWTADGGSGAGSGGVGSSPSSAPTTLYSDFHAEDTIRAEAVKQGYDPTKIKVDWTTRKFEVGGQQFEEGAHADLWSGEIVVRPAAMTPEALPGVMAHEIMHQKFDRVFRGYLEEQRRLHDWAQHDHAQFDAYTRPNGELNTDLAETKAQFPISTYLDKPLGQWDRDLQKADGVTPYSTAYWEAWKKGEVATPQAYHETLAEMARMDKEHTGVAGRAGWAGDIDGRWRYLYNWTNALAQERYGFKWVGAGEGLHKSDASAPVRVDGNGAVVSYLDQEWRPVPASQATTVKVRYPDGRVVFGTRTSADMATKFQKADLPDLDPEELDQLVALAYDSIDWEGMVPDAEELLDQIARAGALSQLAELGITTPDLIAHANTAAQAYAQDRAAEMVGMRRTEDGSLIPNPDAYWAISDSTRDDLRDLIESAFADETPLAEMTAGIEDAGTFAPSRAELIAKTEAAKALVGGNLGVWSELGVPEVEVVLSEDHDLDDECNEVVAGNPYPLDQAPDVPIHPRCECALEAHLAE